MQSKLAIVKLIKTYEIKPCSKTPPNPLRFVPENPFMTPVGGMWLNFKKIE
jgi:hypothetical protein